MRTAARTAVIAGTATSVSNRVSRRQANRWAAEDQQQQYAQQAPGDSSEALTNQLAQLAQLRAQGALTDEEFAAAKAKLIE
jgi:hypothetical protein